MKTSYLLLPLLLLRFFNVSAQNSKDSYEKDFNKAEKMFDAIYLDGKGEALTYTKEGFAEVRPLLLSLYKQDTSNNNVAFKLGVCFLSSRRHRAEAIPYFKKASSAVEANSKNYDGSSYKEKNAPLITWKFLGDAYHLNYKFDAAISAYQKFISVTSAQANPNKVLLAEAGRKIEMCNTGKQLVATPVHLKIENLGNSVNSTFPDYAPVVSADQQTLLFTSRRPETTGGQKDDEGNYLEDIYISTKTKTGWSKAMNIGSPINTNGNEATVGLSPDGQTILIYKDDNGDGNIYSTTLDGDIWSTPVKLNENVNTKYWEPSAFISADGRTLYFTSNRPGGFGGRDLYTCKMTPEGDWGKAENMGAAINTPFDEDAPFIHPDGRTLSFSSNGHNTMGGFDIFTSLLSDDGQWSEPVNVGYPVNTTDDDIYFVVSPDNRIGYFSSFREGGLGEKDNYMVTFLDRKQAPLTLLKGDVFDESGKPAKKVVITVTDNATGEVVGIYHTNSKTGQFLFILTPGKNYNITYQAADHLFSSENLEIAQHSDYYEINRAVALDPIVVGSKITLNNIFFDFDKATLRPLSNVELKNLVMLLKSNPKMKVEISGHTDSKGTDAYNQVLSEQRAQAVVSYLVAHGIPSEQMVAKGYGKTQPVAANTKANGSDNAPGRQLNRRVELKIIQIN